MSIHALTRLAGAAAMGLVLSAAPSFAVDTGGDDSGATSSTASAMPTLSDARADIKAKHWEDAIAKLSRIVQASPTSADAYNLLGYSFRNLGNTKRAMTAYAKALKLDPRHTGALEYQGVLFVMLGDLDKANANLDKIKSICGTACEEYEDLAKAIKG